MKTLLSIIGDYDSMCCLVFVIMRKLPMIGKLHFMYRASFFQEKPIAHDGQNAFYVSSNFLS
jgi:hypothetical protein